MFDPRFGEDRGQVIGPIAQRRRLARQRGQFALHEVAEALAQRVDILPVAIDEIHRHIERVLHIAFKPHAVFKHKRQHTGARAIQIAPNARAPAFVTVRLAFEEGRVRKQRGGHRLQRQRDAEFLDHVGLVREVEVHLHGAGPVHHLFSVGADLVHIVGHQLVTPLGHHRHLFVRPLRRSAQTNEARADLVRDLVHFAQVFVHLVTGLVDVIQGRSRQLKLPTGFQRDVRAFALQADQVASLADLCPIVPIAQTFQHFQDRAVAVIGQRLQRVLAIAELLVLGADLPSLARFAATFQKLGQLIVMGDRATTGLRNGHVRLL